MLQKLKSLLFKLVTSVLLLGVIMFNQNIKDGYLRHDVGSNVVRIYNMEKTGSGTGFHVLVDGEIYILTNRHVCEVADKNKQVLVEKDGVEIPRKIMDVYDNHDLCLIEGMPGHEDYIDIADSDSVGEDLTIIGYPGGRDLTLSHGEYIGPHTIYLGSEVEDEKDCKGEVQATIFGMICLEPYIASALSAIAYGGNSGSPVVNKYGNVIGVLFAGGQQPTNNSMVPLRYIKDFLKGNK